MDEFNRICITQTAATVTSLLSLETHSGADAPIEEVLETAQKKFCGTECDRVFLYNPDAIAMWIYEKYQADFAALEERTDLKIPMLSVVPPVTPVCFASMYSGMEPEKHGILEYEKPVLKVKTIFDDALAEDKKAAIISTEGDSISKIFLERKMDYFIYPKKEQCNKKALELIKEDRYDLIVLYNGDYDHYMHRVSPEGRRAIRALRENILTFNKLYDAVKRNWTKHNTTMVFAPDHGCHRTFRFFGTHRINEPCDMNIMHFYGFIPKEKTQSKKSEKN